MKIDVDFSATVVAEDEMLILVLPTSAIADPYVDGPDPLMEDFKACGLGDRVFILYVDGAQMAKVKK